MEFTELYQYVLSQLNTKNMHPKDSQFLVDMGHLAFSRIWGRGNASDTFVDSENFCALALFAAKWPDGFHCPRCNHTECYRVSTRRLPLYQCHDCHLQTSLTAGTLFEKSKTPLNKWFHAIHLVSTSGITATKLKSIIGVTYKTAWLMLAKIRYALSAEDTRTLLTGAVKINLAFYKEIKCLRTMDKVRQMNPLIAAASIQPGDIMQAVKIKVVPESELKTWTQMAPHASDKFKERNVNPQADVIQCITRLTRLCRPRLLFQPLRKFVRQAIAGINEIHRGIGIKHFQAYMDEFCFRFNTRNSHAPVFDQLQQICASSPPITYSTITSRPKYAQYA